MHVLSVLLLLLCVAWLQQVDCQCRMRTNAILVGHSTQFVEVSSVHECMDACTRASQCKSGVYYAIGPTCVLNDESRLSKPDAFEEDQAEDIVYFDDCEPASAESPAAPGRRQSTSSEPVMCFSENNRNMLGYIIGLRKAVRSVLEAGVYHGRSQSCKLLSATRAIRPAYYISQRNLVYFEVCGQLNVLGRASQHKSGRSNAAVRNPRTTTESEPLSDRKSVSDRFADPDHKPVSDRFAAGGDPKSESLSERKSSDPRDRRLSGHNCTDSDTTDSCERLQSHGLCPRSIVWRMCLRTCGFCAK